VRRQRDRLGVTGELDVVAERGAHVGHRQPGSRRNLARRVDLRLGWKSHGFAGLEGAKLLP
jgi:hypothetical protein